MTITDLQIQPLYEFTHNGVPIATYRPDFQYREVDGKLVVEDVKGTDNPKYLTGEFKLKARLMRAFYDIDVETVVR